MLEQLASQLNSLARQAKQAARYRAIGTELRHAEGLFLFLRWREADEARLRAEEALRQGLTSAAQAEAAAREAVTAREAAEAALPPLREEDAVAAAILQRLMVERDSLQSEADRAEAAVETLTARITQIDRDREREEALNADAGETVERLRLERLELQAAQGRTG